MVRFVFYLHASRRRRLRLSFAFAAVLALAAGLGVPCRAQEASPPAQTKSQGGESLSARLNRLEDKVKDLQVTIGTLQSFISMKPGATLPQEAPAPVPQVQASDPSLGPRIDALETQIKALTNHVEQIGKQMSAIEAKLSALEAAPPPAPIPQPDQPPLRQGEAVPLLPPEGSVQQNEAPQANAAEQQDAGPQDAPSLLRHGETQLPPDELESAPTGSTAEEENFDPSKPRWYGPKPGTDEFAALLRREGIGASPDQPQSLAAVPGADAESLYKQGYGALLQKDYAAAETAFRQLIAAHPGDPLAADAQYWIGETYYVRGQFKPAADAFLTGYKTYKSAQKAPDMLLKLGMSLAELDQKDAACSTFDELKDKFPRAPAHIADEAKAWRKKAGC